VKIVFLSRNLCAIAAEVSCKIPNNRCKCLHAGRNRKFPFHTSLWYSLFFSELLYDKVYITMTSSTNCGGPLCMSCGHTSSGGRPSHAVSTPAGLGHDDSQIARPNLRPARGALHMCCCTILRYSFRSCATELTVEIGIVIHRVSFHVPLSYVPISYILFSFPCFSRHVVAPLTQVDLAGCFEDGQAYTALSRATALSKVRAIFSAHTHTAVPH
jgi:hypothetical protein